MKRHLCVTLFIAFASVFAIAQTVLTVDSSGNVVTATGSVSSTSFNATGTGAGRLSLATGPDPIPLTDAFELLAPLGMTTTYQEIAPNTSGTGLWRSNDSSPASITTAISGTNTIIYNVTSGGSYPSVPACWITVNAGANPATCVANLTGGSSGGIKTGTSMGITISQSGAYTSAAIQIADISQIVFAELSGDATTTGSNLVAVVGLNGTTIPVNSSADQTIVTTSAATGAWKSLPNTSSNQFLTYVTSTHSFGASTVPVTSVFTRTGAVSALSNDYTLDQIGNPAAAKTFALGNANFVTYGDSTSTATGSSNLVTVTDATSNSGTGSLLAVKSAASSSAVPLTVTAKGTANGIQVNNSGVLAKIGTGHVNADQCNAVTCGTVTSVTFTGDGVVDSATPSSAVTSSGTVTAAIINQSANTVLAGPSSGVATAPTFRTLVSADVPTLNQNTTGTSGGLTGTPDITVGTVTATAITGSSLNQTAASAFGGTCSMSTSTTCTLTLAHTYSTPACVSSEQGTGATVFGSRCSVSGTSVTVTASSSNSQTWGVFVFGNPN